MILHSIQVHEQRVMLFRFFAGITIETDDVILDLNGNALKMSERFYYSQPFFSIIELVCSHFYLRKDLVFLVVILYMLQMW